MLLTITSTHPPATDLGYLLHKNPQHLQTFPLSFGQAHVFYPEATAERCTVALVLDINPISLVRASRRSSGPGFALEQYVNDRPYCASSFLSVAIGQIFGSALGGRSKDRPELAQEAIPLTASLPVLSCRGGVGLLERLFVPLGYQLKVQRLILDDKFPEWGESPYYDVQFTAVTRLRDLLRHLYVLIPVLDNDKHYWVGDDEVEKLVRQGEEWLAGHPERELIAQRYLKHQGRLARAALDRLLEVEETSPEPESPAPEEAAPPEQRIRLNETRLNTVHEALKESGARRILDLGCGEGQLLRLLLKDRQFTNIVGMDVAVRVLEKAAQRLRLDRQSERDRMRLTLLHGSLLYRDSRLAGFDAAAVVEVIEHLDPPRLSAFERVLFEFSAPSQNGKFRHESG